MPDYDLRSEIFLKAAARSFEELNSDGFWNFVNGWSDGVRCRLSAHRKADTPDRGHFQVVCELGIDEDEEAVGIGVNAAYSLNRFRDAEWTPGPPPSFVDKLETK
jgi:hypothetical protein